MQYFKWHSNISIVTFLALSQPKFTLIPLKKCSVNIEPFKNQKSILNVIEWSSALSSFFLQTHNILNCTPGRVFHIFNTNWNIRTNKRPWNIDAGQTCTANERAKDSLDVFTIHKNVLHAKRHQIVIQWETFQHFWQWL